MTTTERDVISGVVFAAGSLGFYLYASSFPVREGRPIAVSPGFYPRLLAAILGGLAVIQIITAVVAEVRRRTLAAGDEETPAHLPPIWKDRRSLGLFLLTLAALMAYPFLMRLAGFSVTGFIFFGLLVYALSAGHRSGRGPIVILAVTLGLTVLTFVVFRLLLQIPFPDALIWRP